MKNRYLKMMYVLSFTGLFLTSCYKEFDPKSYAPPFTINGFTSVNQIRPANLIDYWAFQGGLTDSVSDAAGSNSGATFVNGFIGYGLGLNVSNSSYVTADPTNALKSVQSFTISFWVNPTFVDADGNGSIDGALGLINIANPNDFWGYLDWLADNGSTPTSAVLKIHFRGTASSDTWIVPPPVVTGFFGKWTNHTLTYDATTSQVTYYMNGSVLVPATTVPWTGAVDFSGIGPLVFGTLQFQTTPSLGTAGGSQGWASYLTGTIDEVRIYNIALTAAEVNALVVLQGKSSM
jgi:Concanavalin A-like lectin/glucanases superfamily